MNERCCYYEVAHIWRRLKIEKWHNSLIYQIVTPLCAEREGFEPPVPLSTPVFKTGAFDHSAISPMIRLE